MSVMWHQRHLVIGAGQVGRAIFEILIIDDRNTVGIRDVHDDAAMRPDVLHICFPWSSDFERQVAAYQDLYHPELTIIHSTVPVGTSSRLGAVHSPVMGRHPNLVADMKAYPKFFGGSPGLADLSLEVSVRIFQHCGLRAVAMSSSESTEAGKLWQTLQYGWLIALQKEAYSFARAHGADPEEVYVLFNMDYNNGMEQLGLPFRLPIMEDMPGPIGGHCVIPNLALTDSYIARSLQVLNEGWAEQAEQERPAGRQPVQSQT